MAAPLHGGMLVPVAKSRINLLLGLFLAACGGDAHAPGGTPINPGPGGGTVTPPPDAPPVFIDAGSGQIEGTLCLVGNVTPVTTCSPLTNSALTVSVVETGETTTAAADGSFTLPGAPGLTRVTIASASTDPRWFGSVETVAVALDGSATAELHVVTQSDALAFAATNVGSLPAGTGIVVLHTSAGVTVTDGAATLYYDAGGAPLLTVTPPTGASGTAAVFGVTGTQTLHLANGSTSRNVVTVAVPSSITFVESFL